MRRVFDLKNPMSEPIWEVRLFQHRNFSLAPILTPNDRPLQLQAVLGG